MKDLHKLTPFKYFVLTNFPYIEADFDALTNYELFCKVAEYLNNISSSQNDVIDDFNELMQNWETYSQNLTEAWDLYRESLTEAWRETKEYIDNYFYNLNVQDEIDNKIDEMAEAGYFDELFNRVFMDSILSETADTVSEWINANLSQETGYVIDKSLTVENAAADARAVGLVLHTLMGTEYIPDTDGTLIAGYVNSSGEIRNTDVPNRYKMLELDATDIKKIVIMANSDRSTNVSFCKTSISLLSEGDSIDRCFDMKYTYSITAGNYELFEIPTDCNYIEITYLYDGNSDAPAFILNIKDESVFNDVIETYGEYTLNLLKATMGAEVLLQEDATILAGIIGGNGNVNYVTSNGYSCAEFTNNSYKQLVIFAGTGASHVSFLTNTINGLSNGDPAPICSGAESRYDVAIGAMGIFDVPADCTVINVMKRYNGNNFYPAFIFGLGTGIYEQLIEDAPRSVSKTNVTACIIGASVESGTTHETDSSPAVVDPSKAYLTVALQNNGVIVTNKSHGGMGYLRTASDSTVFKDIIDNTDFTEFDSCYITVGSNDWNYNYTLGTPSDATTDSTVCGMLKYAIETIYTSNPRIKLFIKTPGIRGTKGTFETKYGWLANNTASVPYSLKDLHDAIIAVCDIYAVEVIGSPETGIVNAYNMFDVYPDGSHPNQATMSAMAKNMTGRINFK